MLSLGMIIAVNCIQLCTTQKKNKNNLHENKKNKISVTLDMSDVLSFHLAGFMNVLFYFCSSVFLFGILLYVFIA